MKFRCDYTAPEFRTFRDFLDLMGEKPAGTRLQRHHPDAGFTPDNVEWMRWPKKPKRDRYKWPIKNIGREPRTAMPPSRRNRAVC